MAIQIGFGGKVTGVREVMQTLDGVTPREARNLLRSTVHGIAGRVRDKIKQKVPVRTGRLKKETRSRRRRGTPTTVRSDVEMPFYWRFVEYGTRGGNKGAREVIGGRRRKVRRTHPGTPAQPSVTPAVEEVRAQLDAIFRAEFGVRLERVLARKAKKAAAGK